MGKGLHCDKLILTLLKKQYVCLFKIENKFGVLYLRSKSFVPLCLCGKIFLSQTNIFYFVKEY